MRRNSAIIDVMLVVVLAIGFIGCSATENSDGLGTSSPDGRFRLAVLIDGAYGHAYDDKTRKKIWIQIGSGSAANQTPLFDHTYILTGSDIEWQTRWSSAEAVSVELYDWGDGVNNYNNMKHMTASNHIALLSFVFDKSTGKFIER
jgi:hypothetical protein